MTLAARLGFGAFASRNYRLFFAGQATSLLGDGMIVVALSFAVLDLTGKVADLGFVLAAGSLPMIAFLLVGGVFADRLPRRAVMVGADLVRFGSQGTAALLLVTGHAELWHLIVLQAVRGTASAFFNPALTGLTPLLVPRELLQQANVLRGLAQGAGGIAGPAIAGVLVATIGSGWALGVDALTFGASAGCLALLRLPHQHLPPQRFLRDLRDGWQEFRSRTWLWAGVIGAGIANMTAAPFFVIGAAISKEDLGGVGAWALIVSSFAVGGFAGGFVALHLRPERPFVASFRGYLAFALPSLLLAAGVGALPVAVGALAAGAGLMIGNAIWETTLQEQIPQVVLSRVTAYDWFGSLVGQPLGFVLVGPLVTSVGETETLLLASAIIVTSNLVILSLPSIRGVRRKDAGVQSRT